MKKHFLLYLFICTLSFGCTKDESVMIRVKNVSSYHYSNVIVGNTTYNDISANQFSDYKYFASAFSYNYIQLIIDGDTAKLIPVDYVGESKLKHGNYTYEIGVTQDENKYFNITLACVQDK